MGNCSSGSGMFSPRNKEFQAVMPFPNDGMEANQSAKKRKMSPQKFSKTAPSPGGDQEAPSSSAGKIEDSTAKSSKSMRISDVVENQLSSPAPKTDETVAVNASVDSTYMQTESQQRRERMADCEFECSRITSYLYVGGYHVATNREILRQNGITHIINCSAAVVENVFASDRSLRYLALSMVDGRQDDISWFLCEVIQFIMKARAAGGNVLIHCEKGISRSCSYAIAYRMWATGDKWKTCFDYVKKGRSICSPNTAFTCNLIELGELLAKDAARTGAGGNLFFRCAYHLPHDPKTPVLKLCRTTDSRKIMTPATSLLDPKGVFIIRTVFNNNNTLVIDHRIFLWQGGETTDATARHAEILAKKMYGILTTTDKVEWVKQGEETTDFMSYLLDDGVFNASDNSLYDDFYDYPPSEEITLLSQKQMEADHTRNNNSNNNSNNNMINNDNFSKPVTARESSIKGFAEFVEGPLSRESSLRSQPLPLLSRESSTRRSSNVSMDVQAALLLRRASASNATSSTMETTSSSSTANHTNNTNTVRTFVREKSESKVDSYSAPSSSSGSRRNSDLVTTFSRIPSLQLPDSSMTVIEEDRRSKNNTTTTTTTTTAMTSISTGAYAGSPEQLSGRKRNIPELALAGKPGSLLQMQRVSEGDPNCSDLSSSRKNSSRQDTGRDGGEIRSAMAVSAEGSLNGLGLNLTKQSSGGTSKITTSLTPRKDSTTLSGLQLPPLVKVASPKPVDLMLPGLLTTPTKNSPPHALIGKIPIPLSSPDPEAPMLQRNDSQDQMTPPSNRDTRTRGVSSPLSAQGSASNLLPAGQSPLTERRLSGATVSMLALSQGGGSHTNSAASLHAALPLKGIERSPSSERHPLDVGLPRGPTPIEDLSPQDTSGPHSHSPQSSSSMYSPRPADITPRLRPSSSKADGIAALAKPLLFQAVPIDSTELTPTGLPVPYEWQAMGVYDDEDLDEVR